MGKKTCWAKKNFVKEKMGGLKDFGCEKNFVLKEKLPQLDFQYAPLL